MEEVPREPLQVISAYELTTRETVPDPVIVAYDAVERAITFHERASGDFIFDWDADDLSPRRLTDLFLSISGKTWATKRTVHATALAIIQNKLVPGA